MRNRTPNQRRHRKAKRKARSKSRSAWRLQFKMIEADILRITGESKGIGEIDRVTSREVLSRMAKRTFDQVCEHIDREFSMAMIPPTGPRSPAIVPKGRIEKSRMEDGVRVIEEFKVDSFDLCDCVDGKKEVDELNYAKGRLASLGVPEEVLRLKENGHCERVVIGVDVCEPGKDVTAVSVIDGENGNVIESGILERGKVFSKLPSKG